MSIVLVGGHDRLHKEYKGIGSKFGHKVKVYTQMPTKFDKIIGTPDVILLLINTVSHKMVNVAVKEAKRKNIPIIRCHNSSINSVENSMKDLSNN